MTVVRSRNVNLLLRIVCMFGTYQHLSSKIQYPFTARLVVSFSIAHNINIEQVTHCHIVHCNKSKISYSFAPKEMCRKWYIIEQISDTLHEIQLYNVHLMYISQYRKFNLFCSGIPQQYGYRHYRVDVAMIAYSYIILYCINFILYQHA